MNKKVLGVCIPYYKNSEECEIEFKKLMEELNRQLTDYNLTNNIIIYVYEDGQISDWLIKYANKNIIIDSCKKNKGVSYARNCGLDYLIDKVNYILFIDSDDYIENNFLKIMNDYCGDGTHEVVESTFYVNNTPSEFNKNVIRSGVSGTAIKTSLIGEKRFNEKLQIAEDTNFMNDVIDLSKCRKKHAKTRYTYQYGINNNSLIKRFQRKEIKKERES